MKKWSDDLKSNRHPHVSCLTLMEIQSRLPAFCQGCIRSFLSIRRNGTYKGIYKCEVKFVNILFSVFVHWQKDVDKERGIQSNFQNWNYQQEKQMTGKSKLHNGWNFWECFRQQFFPVYSSSFILPYHKVRGQREYIWKGVVRILSTLVEISPCNGQSLR